MTLSTLPTIFSETTARHIMDKTRLRLIDSRTRATIEAMEPTVKTAGKTTSNRAHGLVYFLSAS